MRIAVITPAYNAAATIGDTVASVLAQTHPDWRLIVVDDGSTDATPAIVAQCADPRLTLLRRPNAGVAAARNRGMAEAAGAPFLLFLDADDWLAPEALATLAAALQAAPDAVAAVGAYARVGDVGGYARTGATSAMPRPVTFRATAPRCLLPLLLVRNLFVNGGHVLIRAAAARRAGGFRQGIAYGEDWEFFIRLALLGRFAFVLTPAPVLFVRSRAEGAYRRMAADPEAFRPCMAAIFANGELAERFGPARLAALRRRAEAENAWIVGREQIRHGCLAEGQAWLRRSVRAAPSLRRLALLAAAHALPLLPMRWRGLFRGYGPT